MLVLDWQFGKKLLQKKDSTDCDWHLELHRDLVLITSAEADHFVVSGRIVPYCSL